MLRLTIQHPEPVLNLLKGNRNCEPELCGDAQFLCIACAEFIEVKGAGWQIQWVFHKPHSLRQAQDTASIRTPPCKEIPSEIQNICAIIYSGDKRISFEALQDKIAGAMHFIVWRHPDKNTQKCVAPLMRKIDFTQRPIVIPART